MFRTNCFDVHGDDRLVLDDHDGACNAKSAISRRAIGDQFPLAFGALQFPDDGGDVVRRKTFDRVEKKWPRGCCLVSLARCVAALAARAILPPPSTRRPLRWTKYHRVAEQLSLTSVSIQGQSDSVKNRFKRGGCKIVTRWSGLSRQRTRGA